MSDTWVYVLSGGATAVVILIVLVVGFIVLMWLVDNTDQATKELRKTLESFFGCDLAKLQIVARAFHHFDLPTLQKGIDDYCKELQATREIVGMSGHSLNNVLGGTARKTALRYLEVDIDVGQQLRCTENGLYLVKH